MMRGLIAVTVVLIGFSSPLCRLAGAEIVPPGFAPIPTGHHVLVGGRVVVRPGTELTNGTIVIRDGTIVAVGSGLPAPAGARVWDLAGAVVYAGFLDPYLTLGTNAPPVNTGYLEPIDGSLTSGGPRYFGVTGQERDPGRPGPAHGITDIAPERRVADSLSPDPKA